MSDFLEPNLHAGATFYNGEGKIEKGNFFIGSFVQSLLKKSCIFKLKYL